MENIIRNPEGMDQGQHGKKAWKKPCLTILNITNTQHIEGDGVDFETGGS